MRAVKASAKIIPLVAPCNILKHIEKCGRTCYKSDSEITIETAIQFIQDKLIKYKHFSVLEHVSVTVNFVVNRAISHELVRHRQTHLTDDMEWDPGVSQESTRYVNYNKKGLEYIIPPDVDLPEGEYTWEGKSRTCTNLWVIECLSNESLYNTYVNAGRPPQLARDYLNNHVKTEIKITANLREWRSFLELRALGLAGKPHPAMLEVCVPLLKDFKDYLPPVFCDMVVPE